MKCKMLLLSPISFRGIKETRFGKPNKPSFETLLIAGCPLSLTKGDPLQSNHASTNTTAISLFSELKCNAFVVASGRQTGFN